jgi:hypothetical protein
MEAASFKTANHMELAIALSDLLIEVIREKGGSDNLALAGRLARLREVVWPGNTDTSDEERRQKKEAVFKEVLTGLAPGQKTELLQAYAHMGHLYEMAGLAARENYFTALTQKGEKIPGGVQEFMAKQSDLATAIGKLNQPVFEVVMTMHPTNTNSLESIQAQRGLAMALEKETIDADEVKKAVANFEAAPLLHQVPGPDGKPVDANMTVRDETNMVLNFLGNIYHDLPTIYRQYDDAIAARFGGETYDPLQLALNMRFGSWGSAGDKDGNNSVTAETTLEAIAMHVHAAVTYMLSDMQSLPEAMQQDKTVAAWKKKLQTAQSALVGEGDLLNRIAQLREDSNRMRKDEMKADGQSLNDRFDALSSELVALRRPLDARQCERDLNALYVRAGESQEEKKPLLDLIRKLRVFGFSFGKIEYRETAAEYHRVAGSLIEDYDTPHPIALTQNYPEAPVEEKERMHRLENIAKLENLLQGGDLSYLWEQRRQAIIAQGATKLYSEQDAQPIAYHTLKRMELARDFGDMIRDNVLAECGKIERRNGETITPDDVIAQGKMHLLEAQLLQRVAAKDGKRPLLGIVPLFEEPATMEMASKIMQGAYDSKAYRAHLDALAKDRYDGKATQQVQIAHSDNARRSGLLAARALIHQAHKDIRALNDEYTIRTQFFEGGSLSDAYRNGVRAVSASVNAFELHDFAKFTFQGGDMLNYFNFPSSNVRVFTRGFVDSAERFEKIGEHWLYKNRSSDNGTTPGAKTEKRDTNYHPIMDAIAIAALKGTLKDYQDNDFKDTKMGILLAALDFEGEKAAGTAGSRAGQRGSAAFATSESTQAGKFVDMVNVDKVRTITFSKTLQHMGIVPSWIGSESLAANLFEQARSQWLAISNMPEGKANADEKSFYNKFKGIEKSSSLSPQQINLFYHTSPTFKDAQDRSAFALAMTNPDMLHGLYERIQQTNWRPEEKAGIVAQGVKYVDRILKTYEEAGRFALAARKAVPIGNYTVQMATRDKALPHLKDDITRKSDYRDFFIAAKAMGGLDPNQRRITHNGIDIAMHGRFLLADDPKFGGHVHPYDAKAVAATVVRW